MPRKFYSDWLVKDDEFHPDPRTAAKHADTNARNAAQDYLKRAIARYEGKAERTALDDASLALLRENLRAVEADIEAAKEDDDEVTPTD